MVSHSAARVLAHTYVLSTPIATRLPAPGDGCVSMGLVSVFAEVLCVCIGTCASEADTAF